MWSRAEMDGVSVTRSFMALPSYCSRVMNHFPMSSLWQHEQKPRDEKHRRNQGRRRQTDDARKRTPLNVARFVSGMFFRARAQIAHRQNTGENSEPEQDR